MTKKDWYEAGDQIRNLVQEAVDSKDFSQLSSTISNVVNEAMDGLEDVLRDSLGNSAGRGESQGRPEAGRTAGNQNTQGSFGSGRAAGNQNTQGGFGSDRAAGNQNTQGGFGPGRTGGNDWSYSKGHYRYEVRSKDSRREAAERIRRNMEQKQEQKTYHPVRRKLKVPGQITGNVMKWTGYSLGGMFGLTLALLGAVGMSTGFEMVVPMSIFSVLFVGSVGLGVQGSRKLRLGSRFRNYMNVLGDRTFCLIEELAASVGESQKFVRKDLRRMFRKGFFPQGYIDQKETCLITDRATYQQYLTTQEAYVVREMAAEQKKEVKPAETKKAEETVTAKTEKAAGLKLTPECEELIAQGRSYILHIHECNERIPDVEMSDKLDRLERVVTRIFTEAEKNPEIVDDLKKMMSYYLPTTKKLLNAYCELNEQPIQGQNIENTKKEIENALDTLNAAFEKLLDDLFEEKAWDISSDISVLNTMLAQEGLTGQGFGSKFSRSTDK